MKIFQRRRRIAQIVIIWSVILFFVVTIKLLFDMTFYETMENKREELYDTAVHINTQLQNRLSALSLLTEGTDISAANAAELQQKLQGIYPLGCFDASIYDANGNLITRAPNKNTAEDENDLRAFQQAMEGMAAISGKIVQRQTNASYVVFNIPLVDQAMKIRGVLVAYVYLAEVDSVVNEFVSGAGQSYFVLDSEGFLLNRTDKVERWDRQVNMNLFEGKYVSKRPNDFLKNSLFRDAGDVHLYLNLEYSSWRVVKAVSIQLIYREIFWAGLPYFLVILLGNSVIGLAVWFVNQEYHRVNLREKMRIERLTSASQIAAGIAHEIKNPLTAIKGFLQVMQRKDRENFFGKYLPIMLNEVERIELLTNQFCTLARPLEKEKYTAIALYDIIAEIAILVEPGAAAKGVQFRFTASGQREEAERLFCIQGNAGQIKQVLINLIKNAIEATPDQGHVDVLMQRSGRQIFVRVRDDGAGIRPEDMEKIGTPFFTTKENGTGLGLMISFEIVRRHGGQMKVTSVLKAGSEFSLQFPAVH